jgi:hypothetical protein
MDASAYALVHGLHRTRGTLAKWRAHPWPIVRGWLVGSAAVTLALLGAVWVLASVSRPHGAVALDQPPFAVGGPADVLRILSRNLLVLALHAMACVAGFIAGSSLPLQAERRTGLDRAVHERGRPIALAVVICATGFSLSMQTYVLGSSAAAVAASLGTSPGLLLVSLLPHAFPELVGLFLPLAAWLLASRRGAWDELLAATLVTVTLALPLLVLAAVWEVYAAPHLIWALVGHP